MNAPTDREPTVPVGRNDTQQTREVRYDGGFWLEWLADGETVSSAGDGTGAAIVTRTNGDELRIDVGDTFLAAGRAGTP